jgi:hypothetical protein
MVYAFIKSWKNHVNTTLDSLLEAYQAGINNNGRTFAEIKANPNRIIQLKPRLI